MGVRNGVEHLRTIDMLIMSKCIILLDNNDLLYLHKGQQTENNNVFLDICNEQVRSVDISKAGKIL